MKVKKLKQGIKKNMIKDLSKVEAIFGKIKTIRSRSYYIKLNKVFKSEKTGVDTDITDIYISNIFHTCS